MTRRCEDLFVLSTRNMDLSSGWCTIYDFENVLLHCSGGHLLAPAYRRAAHMPIVRGVMRRIVGRHTPAKADVPIEGRTLIIVSPMPDYIDTVSAIPDWRKRFDIVALYLIDSQNPMHFGDWVARMDHIFVPIPETIESVQRTTGVPTSLLPVAADVLAQGSSRPERLIDVVAYGRQPAELSAALKMRFNRPGSGRLFMHSPFGYHRPSTWAEDRLLFWKLLRRSRIALAFDTTEAGRRETAHELSVLTPRWFECLAAGCVVVGDPPATPLADQLLDWEDATIRLTGSTEDQLRQIDDLLQDQPRLHAASQRNYQQMLARHDWRHRAAAMFDQLALPRPDRLQQELDMLHQLSAGPDTPAGAATAEPVDQA